jgi:hypothetical protein
VRALNRPLVAVASIGAALGLGACTGPARISLGATAPSTTTSDGAVDGRMDAPAAAADGIDDGPTSDASGAPSDAPAPPTFFLAPNGNDANAGTRDQPWRTFAFAVPKLTPGATLVLRDGAYDGGTSGYFNARCGANAASGEPTARITVRAEHERMAWLRGDASGPPFFMEGCGDWTIEGLRLESADLANAPDTPDAGSVVLLGARNHDVTLRRLLAGRPNRYKHSHVVRLGDGSRNVLVEECEVYDFHHNAFEATRSDSVIFRRNYVNARQLYARDIAGAYVSVDPERGDYGFLLEETRFAIVENNVVENVYGGIGIVGRYTGFPADQPPPLDPGSPIDGNRVLGNVVHHAATYGVRLESRCSGAAPCTELVRVVRNTELTDNVVVGGAAGVSSSGAVRTTIEGLTVVGAQGGVVLVKEAANAGVSSSSSTVDAVVVDFQAAGFSAEREDDWSFDHCAAGPAVGAPGAAYVPDDAHVTGRVAAAPELGGCLVYLPKGSALRGAGVGARDVGANVLARYEGGLLTTKPLWDPTTGAFPCGALIDVNDDPATSCIGVHTRLHVAATDCPLP